MTVDNQFSIFYLDRAVELTMHCIILKHVCHILYIDKVIDTYYLDVISFLCGSENQTADTTKTVNTNFNFAHNTKNYTNVNKSRLINTSPAHSKNRANV